MQLGLAEVNLLVNYYWAMMDSDLEQVMFGTLFASFKNVTLQKNKNFILTEINSYQTN